MTVQLSAISEGVGVGGTSSYGYTITQAFDIQSFFRYESSFMFFGDKTGDYYSLIDFTSTNVYNPFSTLKTIVGSINEKTSYYDPAN
jgi:hypothetical protein